MEFYSTFIALPLEDRQKQSFRLIKRFPGKYPIIIDRANRSTPKIDKNKFIIHGDTCISELMILLRKKINLSPAEGIFMFCDDNIVSGNMTISQLHHLSGLKRNDGFTYILYSLENTFGGSSPAFGGSSPESSS
jgi:hypothetical protein